MSSVARRGRVAILISGRGSNMAALVEAMKAGKIAADPVLVLSDVPGAPGLERAKALGVATTVVFSREFRTREAHEEAVLVELRRKETDLVCLAGYMRLLSPRFIEAYRHRIMNIHPALLPAFPGLEAQRQALEHGVKVSGCTVHFVDEECDHGPIILQAALPVREDDTVETLSARILELEHRIYPEAVGLFFEGRLRVAGRRVSVLPGASA